MNNSSATTIPCAGCNCYLGDVTSLVVDFDGFRYRVCGHGCANRLLARLSQSSTTSTTKCVCQQPLPPRKTTFCSKECQRTERLRRARASAAAAGTDPLRVDVLGRTPRKQETT